MLPHLCIVSTISLLVCDSCGWSYSVYFSSTLSMSVEAYWNSCTTSSAYTGLQTMIKIPCCGSWRWWRRSHSRTEHSAHKLSSSDQISAWWRSLVCSSRRISARCWSSSCPCSLITLYGDHPVCLEVPVRLAGSGRVAGPGLAATSTAPALPDCWLETSPPPPPMLGTEETQENLIFGAFYYKAPTVKIVWTIDTRRGSSNLLSFSRLLPFTDTCKLRWTCIVRLTIMDVLG